MQSVVDEEAIQSPPEWECLRTPGQPVVDVVCRVRGSVEMCADEEWLVRADIIDSVDNYNKESTEGRTE